MSIHAKTLRRWCAYAVRGAKRTYGEFRFRLGEVHPQTRQQRRADAALRAAAEDSLRAIATAGQRRFEGPVLIDAMWDNPNYWYRLSLLRGALGTAAGTEIGLTGPYQSNRCAATLRRLGIGEIRSFDGDAPQQRDLLRDARRLLAGTSAPAEILGWRLPFDFPASIVFDGILKRQRAATIALDDPLLESHVAEALASIRGAQSIIERHRPRLVALSHAVNFRDAALAWAAQRREIPSVVLFGNYGVPRFWRIDRAADLFDSVDRPTGAQLDALAPAIADRLADTGERYLSARLGGATNDIGARYAFQRNRDTMDRRAMATALGWDADRPIVTVYASNWFDFPHGLGMTHFVDFLDWLKQTLDSAVCARDANWLFRAHPCDAWYGGVTLADLMPADVPRHVRLCPPSWNGAAVMAAADALVTYHGTAGIEYAAAGKPVLVADRGWYHDCGFVRMPASRADYLALLAGPWWRGAEPAVIRRRALLFAGMYFAHPARQGGLVFGDDSEQASLYAWHNNVETREAHTIAQEIDDIAKWWDSGDRFFHTWKMLRADAFALPVSAAT